MCKLKYYQKLIRSLFVKYSSSGFHAKKGDSFDYSRLIEDSISIPELWKFIKEHDLKHLITLKEVKKLALLLSTKMGVNYG